MGGPGDHWLTDLKFHQLPAFGEPMDTYLRDIIRFGGERLLESPPWHQRLWDTWPQWGRSEAKDARLDQYAAELLQVRDRLRHEATANGWEVRDDG